MNIKKPRGTRDFAPEEMAKRCHAESMIRQVMESYNYSMIQTPTFEHTSLFELKSGEEIAEHMYVFEDKGGRSLCLRPEATASVCRMYAEELRDRRLPVKLYYSCSMFRYERPQKGRYREFWQLGLELLGPRGPAADAETIMVAYDSLKKLGLSFELEIGHIGLMRGLMEDLSVGEDKQEKIIAAIDKGDEEALKTLIDEEIFYELLRLKGSEDVLGKAESLLEGHEAAGKALSELKQVLSVLDVHGLDYVLDLGIARGLEYYTGMVFEVRVPELGAQAQVCGGGRYDKLIELFSGISVPAVGFAFGFDRLMNALEAQGVSYALPTVDVVVAPVNAAVRSEASKVAAGLRDSFRVDFDVMDRKLDKILKYAGDINARYAVIVGPKDLAKKEVTVRELKTGKQENVRIEKLKEHLTQ